MSCFPIVCASAEYRRSRAKR